MLSQIDMSYQKSVKKASKVKKKQENITFPGENKQVTISLVYFNGHVLPLPLSQCDIPTELVTSHRIRVRLS